MSIDEHLVWSPDYGILVAALFPLRAGGRLFGQSGSLFN